MFDNLDLDLNFGTATDDGKEPLSTPCCFTITPRTCGNSAYCTSTCSNA